MKALFYSTATNECVNHVAAWPGESVHVTFNHIGIKNDWMLIEAIQEHKPEVVFYIGAVSGSGNPKPETFKEARKYTKLINICSDAEDRPWHGTLEYYKKYECFDLQVAIDGALNAPVDHSTLTPVNPQLFSGYRKKYIRCGFSGTVGRWNRRSEIVNSLEWFGGLTVRKRSEYDGYMEHIDFMKSCQMILNISYTGSGNSHHIKGRVIEAGLAGCALLEHKDSPFAEWFPKDAAIFYSHPKEIAKIIADMDNEEIQKSANLLNKTVVERYNPKTIYGEILKYVDIAQPW